MKRVALIIESITWPFDGLLADALDKCAPQRAASSLSMRPVMAT